MRPLLCLLTVICNAGMSLLLATGAGPACGDQTLIPEPKGPRLSWAAGESGQPGRCLRHLFDGTQPFIAADLPVEVELEQCIDPQKGLDYLWTPRDAADPGPGSHCMEVATMIDGSTYPLGWANPELCEQFEKTIEDPELATLEDLDALIERHCRPFSGVQDMAGKPGLCR